MCYTEVMAKDVQISIRVTDEWLAEVDAAVEKMRKEVGVPVSRNSFIELAVRKFLAGD